MSVVPDQFGVSTLVATAPVAQAAEETGSGDSRFVSIVVPCFCEEGNIARTIQGLVTTMSATSHPFEIIVVDDGSRDGTWRVICEQAGQYPQVLGVRQMRNYGQTQAYRTGFEMARGTYVLTCSADLECPFETLLDVLEHLKTGADFVNTCRSGRWSGRRAWMSRFANWVINRVSGLHIEDRGSGTKGMLAPLAKSLCLYGELHRFLPDYASIHTTSIVEIPTSFQDRDSGASAYTGQHRALNVLLDSITLLFALSSSRKPFRLLPGRVFGFIGLLVFIAGLSVSVYLAVGRLLLLWPLGDRPLFWVSMLWTILGVIMIMLGAMGEMILRNYHSINAQSQSLARQIIKHEPSNV